MRTIVMLKDTKDVTVGGKNFKISRIPALEADNIYKAVSKAMVEHGNLGMTMLDQDVVRSIFSYVAKQTEDGGWLVLETADSINFAFDNYGDRLKLQVMMIKENFGFLLTDGGITDVLGLQMA